MTVVDEQSLEVDLDHLRSLTTAVIEAEGYPLETEVSVTLISDEEMTGHHREAMGLDGPTDVLSFPLEMLVPGRPPVVDPAGPPIHLGDVLIAPALVQRQATEYGVSFRSEISLMCVHGILHLMGYDHMDDADAEIMEERERRILGEFGLERR